MLSVGSCKIKGKIPFMNKESIKRFKERDKLVRMKQHDGQWTNTENIIS